MTLSTSTVRSPLMPPPTSWTGFWLAKLEGGLAPRDAESLFVALLQERPEDYDSRIGLADVRLWLGRHDAAEADLEALDRPIRETPTSFIGWAACVRPRAIRAAPRATSTRPSAPTSGMPTQERRSAGRAGLALGDGTGVLRRPAVPAAAASNGGTASLEARPTGRPAMARRGHSAGEVRPDRSPRGREVAHRWLRSMSCDGSVYVAWPGRRSLTAESMGIGSLSKLRAGLELYADYTSRLRRRNVHDTARALRRAH